MQKVGSYKPGWYYFTCKRFGDFAVLVMNEIGHCRRIVTKDGRVIEGEDLGALSKEAFAKSKAIYKETREEPIRGLRDIEVLYWILDAKEVPPPKSKEGKEPIKETGGSEE